MTSLYNLFYATLFAYCFSSSAHATPLSHEVKTSITQEVQHAFKQLVLSFSNLDSKAYFQFIDKEKFIGLNADGTVIRSVTELKISIDSAFSYIKKVTSLEFPYVKITVIDENTVLLANEYQHTIQDSKGAHHNSAGGGVQVWSKSSGKWLLVSISSSVKP